MNYHQIRIVADEAQQEQLISLLDEMNAIGFEQQTNVLIGYFKEDDISRSELQHILSNHQYTIDIIEEQNWNQLWESNFQPVVVDNFCAVRADFHEPIRNVQHDIIITPKMSFGTGHHATTYMMIRQMQQLNFQNKTVFDFGTGTGILAILSEQLGANDIIATDIDVWSINNAAENIEKNQCHHIRLYQSANVPSDTAFQIILANINKQVILENLSALAAALTDEGILVVSGLLDKDKTHIIEAATNVNLTLINLTEKEGWIALIFVNVKSK